MSEQLCSVEWTGPWREALDWCPSQLWRSFYDPVSHLDCELYVRWRHADPWTISFYSDERPTVWVRIGSGFTRTTPVALVEEWAELLLSEYFRDQKG